MSTSSTRDGWRIDALDTLIRSFPRRQQARSLRRAGASGVAAVAAGALALTTAFAGASAPAGFLALVMAALAMDTRRWMRLAARNGVGARSEAQVRRVLDGLEAEGWRLRHSLLWGGRGDIDWAWLLQDEWEVPGNTMFLGLYGVG